MVEQNGLAITDIERPSKKVQVAAVRQNWRAYEHIDEIDKEAEVIALEAALLEEKKKN